MAPATRETLLREKKPQIGSSIQNSCKNKYLKDAWFPVILHLCLENPMFRPCSLDPWRDAGDKGKLNSPSWVLITELMWWSKPMRNGKRGCLNRNTTCLEESLPSSLPPFLSFILTWQRMRFTRSKTATSGAGGHGRLMKRNNPTGETRSALGGFDAISYLPASWLGGQEEFGTREIPVSS